MHNKQEVIGNLADDAQISLISEDRAVINFSVASTHKYLNRQGEPEEHTEWFKVKTFCTKRAANEFFAHCLTKGALVYCEGRTRTEKFRKDNGEVGYNRFIECEPHNVKPLSRPEKKAKQEGHDDRESDRRPARNGTSHRPTGPSRPRIEERSDLMNFDEFDQ